MGICVVIVSKRLKNLFPKKLLTIRPNEYNSINNIKIPKPGTLKPISLFIMLIIGRSILVYNITSTIMVKPIGITVKIPRMRCFLK
jgi:hypothetical protein